MKERRDYLVRADGSFHAEWLSQFETLAHRDGLALLRLDTHQAQKVSEATHRPQGLCGGILDVTHRMFDKSPRELLQLLLDNLARARRVRFELREILPASPRSVAVGRVSRSRLQTTLNDFEAACPYRYAYDANGVSASTYVHNALSAIAGLTVQDYPVPANLQNATGNQIIQSSVLATLPGTDPTQPGVVLGAHLDTLGATTRGADDDASGVAVVLEALQALIDAGVPLKGNVYCAFYSNEESGMHGSYQLAEMFESNLWPLAGALQFDMCGCVPAGGAVGTIHMLYDPMYTNDGLSDLLIRLAADHGIATSRYNFSAAALSDYTSWSLSGYPAAYPMEGPVGTNPNIHSPLDTVVDIDHMLAFARLATAAAVELAQPSP
jgi:bacterial leucyl aminopeptidase